VSPLANTVLIARARHATVALPWPGALLSGGIGA
jgi:hypothetical protein